MGTFADRYGPWAVVAGGSSGIGGAFAAELARRGCDLVLLAVDGDELEATAAHLRTTHGIEVRTVVVDLARDDLLEVLRPHLVDLEVGLVVHNAALAPSGRFDEVDPDLLDTAVALNVHGPVRLVRELAPRLVARGRGGIVLMASLASLQGTGTLATYAATKAFNRILAEGLWADLRPQGVDVVAVAPGATDTPTYRRAGIRGGPALGDAEDVARAGLDGLGGGPVVVPGRGNRLQAQVVARLLPRRTAISVVSRVTRRMYAGPDT